MIFRHILVPYDGSEPSARALDKALEIVAKDSGPHLTVAHAINLQPVTFADVTFVQPDFYQEQVKAHGEKIIDKIKQITRDVPHANAVILAGPPAEAILDYADNNGCDLIVMGNRGLSSFKEFMLGSVSHNVILHSRIPVMVMK
ncbi:universal stress protein [Cohnella terricola]|uniref:Universal stress protein n=1 Tax=Cohnella terricola TaxID=1289167 RepID=A0A559JAG2_9BACL|nr:universal stress protein [Cohnella terricola]TVX96866.1 universal stress protein [Cohnella terricola]